MRRDREEDAPHDDEPAEPDDSELATEAEVTCPYCGESVILALDPDGGLAQEYIEDCQVCCRPWRVHVSYDDEGVVEVSVEQAE
ncbi:MAG TPA: CPXCG motif-containing cysteine-rich protein [Gemmatimonadales bacterium]|nr:CPXCG motif-containing cysteine-rich protein [Gemmatimonadales bacterium]